MSNYQTDIELVAVDTLIPYSNNPKAHPEEQVNKIASSIKNYGWDQPIVVDGDGEIIKGHGRLQAAQKLGLDEVPVIWREDLTDAEAKAARIADNKTAESEWLDDELATELELLGDFDDVELGFDEGEVDEILADFNEDSTNELTETPLSEKALEDWNILNLYAGIGGNRRLWGDEPNVTAVEYNQEIADAYQEYHPDDEVVVADAHEYLEKHYEEYDFIWSSPPCPTHSKLQKTAVAAAKQGNTGAIQHNKQAEYPDMNLYEEIIFLDHFFDGKFVVENVMPYYNPLIEPQKLGRHCFWANFPIQSPEEEIEGVGITDVENADQEQMAQQLGFDFDKLPNPQNYGRFKVLKNCITPEIGKVLLESALDTDKTLQVTNQ
ncbi:hypothetical protein OSG_eHP27_00160 [environmental Halophage eHP-27]|nr:hypothetical protein OSG_eHP27_00160 [environmental Halophage eHP-27]